MNRMQKHNRTLTIQLMLLSFFFVLISFAFCNSYTVQSGDTLSAIARNELGESARWQEIAELNHLKEPYTLHIGQNLQMPSGYKTEYIQQELSSPKKENLFKNTFLFFSFLSIPFVVIIGFLLLTSLISNLFFALGYAYTCRIFKIETTLKKCFLAVICLSGIGVLLNLLLPYTESSIHSDDYFIIRTGVVLLYLIFSIMFLKYFFRCHWLHSVCIYLIGGLIGVFWHLLVTLLICLPVWIYYLTQRPEIL